MKNRLYIKDLFDKEISELYNIWHLSKVYSNKRYDRLIYTVNNFIEKYNHYETNRGSIYKIIDENTQMYILSS